MGPRVWDRRRLLHSTFEVEGEPSWGGRAYTHTYSFNLYSFVFKPLRTWTKEDWYWLADLLVYPPSLQKKTAFDDYLLTVFSGRKETSIECLLSLSLFVRFLLILSLSLYLFPFWARWPRLTKSNRPRWGETELTWETVRSRPIFQQIDGQRRSIEIGSSGGTLGPFSLFICLPSFPSFIDIIFSFLATNFDCRRCRPSPGNKDVKWEIVPSFTVQLERYLAPFGQLFRWQATRANSDGAREYFLIDRLYFVLRKS